MKRSLPQAIAFVFITLPPVVALAQGATEGTGPAPAADQNAQAAAASAPTEPAAQTPMESGQGQDTGKQDEKKDEKKKEFRRPFAGSALYWDNSFTAISLDKSHDYTWNPEYSMGFGVRPTWAVTESISLNSDLGFSVELTNSDFSNRKNEVFFNDIPLGMAYKYKMEINNDVSFGTGLSLSVLFPTSKMSQYATLYTAIGIGTNATFTFPNVLSGLSIGWSPGFKKYFHESENPHPEGNPLDESPIPDIEKNQSEHYQALAFADGENPSWSVSNALRLSLSFIEEFSFAFGYTHRYVYLYSAENTGEVDEDTCRYLTEGCEGPRDTGYDERGLYLQEFTYSFDYTPWDMITFSLGAVTSSNQLGPDGQYRTPFFNRETMITFGVSLDIDATVNAAQSTDEGEKEEK